jgi:hypothetical protein
MKKGDGGGEEYGETVKSSLQKSCGGKCRIIGVEELITKNFY